MSECVRVCDCVCADACVRVCACGVCVRPAEQRVVGALQGLVLQGVLLQPAVVLQQLLGVGPGALHLLHLGAQLRLQLLPPPRRLLQQRAQLAGLRGEEG